jgi:hypothetical protein
MILPKKLLLEGIRVLDPFFAPRGFHFQFRGEGKGSGGEYAWGEYTRHDRRLELHFRFTLGLVSYHISDLGASHETYMRQLGVWEQCRFPGFSNDPLLAFANLTQDLLYAEDFLSGSGDVLRMAAVIEEAVAKERSADLMATAVADTQKIEQLRDRFREHHYDEVVKIAAELKFPNRLSASQRRIIEIAISRVNRRPN